MDSTSERVVAAQRLFGRVSEVERDKLSRAGMSSARQQAIKQAQRERGEDRPPADDAEIAFWASEVVDFLVRAGGSRKAQAHLFETGFSLADCNKIIDTARDLVYLWAKESVETSMAIAVARYDLAFEKGMEYGQISSAVAAQRARDAVLAIGLSNGGADAVSDMVALMKRVTRQDDLARVERETERILELQPHEDGDDYE